MQIESIGSREDGVSFSLHRELPREELIEKANIILDTYAENAIKTLRDMVRKGEGKHVLGSVPGRPEDEQLGIDAMGENILGRTIEKLELPAYVMGEHNYYNFVNAEEGMTHVVFAIDSFDNTSQYKRGLDTSLYTVVGVYHQNGEPIGAVIGDIKDKKIYVARGGRTYLRDLEKDTTIEIAKSERMTIKDDCFTLATYLGSKEYSLKFFHHFERLLEDMPPKAVLYGGGGAYIYGLLASGAVDVYAMFNEPCTEIDPGLPLALAAGCTVVSVNPDGSFDEYNFNSARHKEGRVPFFIAACTPELRDKIINYALEKRKTLGLGPSDPW